jgi:hypothetical protein
VDSNATLWDFLKEAARFGREGEGGQATRRTSP